MIHFRSIAKILGVLLLIEAGLLLLCALIPFFLKENDFFAFIASGMITACAGAILFTIGKKRGRASLLSRRDGYVVVTFSWVCFSLGGCLPFLISGALPCFTDAFFESMANFTTTGATVITQMSAMTHGLVFWRSLSNWMGGLGIVFFTVAVLPIFGSGDVQLFAAEATGPTRNKLHPRISVSGRWILMVYVVFTALCFICLRLCRISGFDAINHSLCVMSTSGGYSFHGGVAQIGSVAAQYVMIVFMFLAGLNFGLLFVFFFKLKFRSILHDTEFKWFFFTTIGVIALVFAWLYANGGYTLEESFRHSAFQVISCITSTGYNSADFTQWPQGIWMILSLCMVMGACAGSTTSGVKSIRWLVLFKIMGNDFNRILHPNAILPVRLNGKVVPQSTLSAILSFTMFFVGIIFASWIVYMIMGLNMDVAYGASIAMFCNSGIGVGGMGITIPWSDLSHLGKWFSSVLMLMGRLEIFSMLILFSPNFWKHY